MSKELTEKWKDGTLERGYYYYESKVGAKIIGFQCYGLKYPYDYNHNTIESVKEVLAPVPTFNEYQALLSDQLAKNEGVEINAELEAENKKLKKQLDIATKALKEYSNSPIGSKYHLTGITACITLKEMEDVK